MVQQSVTHLFNQQTLLEYPLRPGHLPEQAHRLGPKGWQNEAGAVLWDLFSPSCPPGTSTSACPKLTSSYLSFPPFGLPVPMNDTTGNPIAQARNLGYILDFSLPQSPFPVQTPHQDFESVYCSRFSWHSHNKGPLFLAWTCIEASKSGSMLFTVTSLLPILCTRIEDIN